MQPVHLLLLPPPSSPSQGASEQGACGCNKGLYQQLCLPRPPVPLPLLRRC